MYLFKNHLERRWNEMLVDSTAGISFIVLEIWRKECQTAKTKIPAVLDEVTSLIKLFFSVGEKRKLTSILFGPTLKLTRRKDVRAT
jgi:hypothetical protein